MMPLRTSSELQSLETAINTTVLFIQIRALGRNIPNDFGTLPGDPPPSALSGCPRVGPKIIPKHCPKGTEKN